MRADVPPGAGLGVPARGLFVCAAACAARHPRHPRRSLPSGSDVGGMIWPDVATELRLPWGGIRIMDVHRWAPRGTLALSGSPGSVSQAHRGLGRCFIEVIYIIPTT